MKNTILILTCMVLIATIISITIPTAMTSAVNSPDVIIDAGHGEPDGGAVAIDNTTESELNLAIANKIYNNLSKSGLKVIMTRTDNNGVYTQGETIHAKKVSDIRNRVELAKKYENALVLSVHMNTYPNSSVCGAQAFYSKNSDKAKEIANELQNVFNLNFNSNAKTIKPISSNVYLFNHIPNDCVLLECGFLTNEQDLNNLKNEDYQTKLAQKISEAILFKLLGG